MNKYLEVYNKIREFAQKELDGCEYEVITKCLIANELDYLLGWDDFVDINLTDEQQEQLINIIYKIHMSVDEPPTVFETTRATINVVLEYGTFEKFIEIYINDVNKIETEIIWRF